jgi:hypothetical protein
VNNLRRWKGLAALVQSAVENGSVAIERVQKDTANLPFGILEKIPEIAPAARGVHVVHDACVGATHGAIRLVTRAVGGGVAAAISAFDDGTE